MPADGIETTADDQRDADIPRDARSAPQRDAHIVGRRWRRWLRFSVRGLMVLVLAVGCVLAYIPYRTRLGHEAIAAIIRSGGFVTYKYGSQPGGSGNGAGLPGLSWVSTVLGTDKSGDVIWVNFRKTAMDKGLDYVGRLPNVRVLDVTDSAVTDDGLRNLRELISLNELHLGGTRITDAGLVHLKGLTQLSSLDVGRTRITDAGLVYLKRFPQLLSLDLADTGVTDAGLAYLSGLSRLRRLTLPLGVSKEGVRRVQGALPSTRVFHGPPQPFRPVLHN